MSEKEKSLQSSPQLVFNEQQDRIAVVLSEKETIALYKKSHQTEYSFDTLQEVYRRGYLSWDLHLNESPEQTAFNRVNSFISGGFAAVLDEDLNEAFYSKTRPTQGFEHKGKVIGAITKTSDGYVSRRRKNPNTTSGIQLMKVHKTREAAEKHLISKSGLDEDLINELSPELIGKVSNARTIGGKPSKTAVAYSTLDKAAKKAWLKSKIGVKKEEVNIPQKYRAGLSDTTAAARKAHWEKMSKYSDRDSRAYQPAPGDATAKTIPSKHTKKFKKMYGEEMTIDEAAETGLAAKAKKSGVSIGTLRKVYNRGMAAWNSGHRPGTTPQQWAMARVNSYITKGKGTYHGADKDLREDDLEEKGPGLWANIHAKRERIKAGSGERMRKPGSKGAPNAAALKSAKEEYTGTEKVSKKMEDPSSRFVGTDELTNNYKNATPGQKVKKVVKEVVEEKLYEMYNCGCNKCGEIEESGLRAKHKSPSGGLTQAGRNYYNRTTGANLKAPVTTKPSKLKKGSKSANRRKSFCARMGGMKKRLTSAKTARDPDSRINKALRKWNC
jgi:hypothetical protein